MQNVTPGALARFLRPVTVALIIAGILVVSFLGTSVYIVDQTEESVITRFGKFHDIKGAGLHFRLPFGIDKQYLDTSRMVSVRSITLNTQALGSATRYWMIHSTSMMLRSPVSMVDSLVIPA